MKSMTEQESAERKKRELAERFASLEKYGVDRVKHDLLNNAGQIVGGDAAYKEYVWEWVRMKESEAKQ